MIKVKPIASSSRGNAYLLDDGEAPLLLDCGLPFKKLQGALNYRATQLAGCLISHEHRDHCRGADRLASSGIDIYASRGTMEGINLTARHRQRIINVDEQFNVGEPFAPENWIIRPFAAVHDAAEPMGFLVYHRKAKDKILYAIDTMYIKHSFTGLTHVMIEASYSRPLLLENVADGVIPTTQAGRLLHNHQSIETALAFLENTDLSKCREIYLMHLSDGNSDQEQFKEKAQRVTGLPVYVCSETEGESNGRRCSQR